MCTLINILNDSSRLVTQPLTSLAMVSQPLTSLAMVTKPRTNSIWLTKYGAVTTAMLRKITQCGCTGIRAGNFNLCMLCKVDHTTQGAGSGL